MELFSVSNASAWVNIAMLSDLPTEILKQVFEDLDYITLTFCIPLVNRRFRSIIQHVSTYTSAEPLSRALFRHRNPNPGSLVIHPLFNLLKYRDPDNVDALTVGVVIPPHRFVPIRDLKTSIAAEPAVLPPWPVFEVHVVHSWYRQVYVVRGEQTETDIGKGRPAVVTVYQVMDQVCRALGVQPYTSMLEPETDCVVRLPMPGPHDADGCLGLFKKIELSRDDYCVYLQLGINVTWESDSNPCNVTPSYGEVEWE